MAKKNNIPITRKKTIKRIKKIVKKNKYQEILEIGTAIGFFSIYMAKKNKKVKITTIEKNKKLYKKANENIKKHKVENNIRLTYGDALDIDIDRKFDLIYIDGAKSKYLQFFNKYSKNLEKNGKIICDNLKLAKVRSKKSKRAKTLLKKMHYFKLFLYKSQKFETKIIEIDDWFSISTFNS